MVCHAAADGAARSTATGRGRFRLRRGLAALLMAAGLAGLLGGGLWAATASAPATSAPATAPTTAAGTPAAQDLARAQQVAEHYAQAKTFYADREFRSARGELLKSLALDPSFPDAQLLMAVIDERLAHPTAANGGPASAPAPDPRLLTEREINRVRLLELTTDDHLLKGRIARRDLEQLWEKIVLQLPVDEQPTRGDRERFMQSANFAQQVDTILTRRAQDFYDTVDLVTEPVTLSRYRSLIQPVVLQSCATAGCHSSQDHHSVVFFGGTSGRVSLAESYTNFYTLSTYQVGNDSMIDRHLPMDSLLLQYLLPPNVARAPHPRKAPLSVAQRAAPESQKYRQVLNWIEALQYPARDYAFVHGVEDLAPPATSAPAAGGAH
jgi:hypothetical protein